jgi:hypothetical protein
MVVRELEELNRAMLPAALLAPTAAHPHLLLHVHTSAPAEPRVFSTKERCPYLVFVEAVGLGASVVPVELLRTAESLRQAHGGNPQGEAPAPRRMAPARAHGGSSPGSIESPAVRTPAAHSTLS